MLPMSEMPIVEIDVTTRCNFQCSGCTRMIGHVPVRDMDLDTFERAVDSVADYPRMISLIGGEPLLWPHFDAATDYLVTKTATAPRRSGFHAPVPDLTRFLLDNYGNLRVKRGLFTSLPPNTIRHWAKILESYQYIGFNTHENAGLHQQFLVAGNELPIPRKQRLRMIQDCWVNKYWSCSITPQGCWPCEIMGTLAHAFDGPGPKQGWPIERGWWRRPPSDWGNMLEWCEICGAALDVPRLLATSDREIVSPANYARLVKMGSKKVKKGTVEVLDVASYDPSKYAARKHNEWYLPSTTNDRPDASTRLKPTSNNLRPRRLECVMVCVGYSDFLEITLPWNVRHWDKTVVVTSPEDSLTAETAKKYGALVVISDSYRAKGARFNKGSMLNAGMAALDHDDWVMLTDADILLPPDFREIFDHHVWNPDIFYQATRLNTPRESPLQWINKYKQDPTLADTLPADPDPWGYFQLFHSAARSLRGLGKNVYSEAFFSAGNVDKHFMERWPDDKRYLTHFKVVHIDHGPQSTNWCGRRSPPLGSSRPTGVIPSDDWTPAGWLDENGFHPTLLSHYTGVIKLYRTDTGEYIIVDNQSPPRRFVHHNRFEFNAYHCGVVTENHEVAVIPTNQGKIVVHRADGHEYTGWGLGHVMFEDDRQGYVWNGVAIGKTNFEIFQKATLSPEDARLLLHDNPPTTEKNP